MSNFLSRYRNCFLVGDVSKMPASIRKRDLIDTVKLVGRQHSFLTGIVDQLNFCYSFQVFVFIFIFSNHSILFTVFVSYKCILDRWCIAQVWHSHQFCLHYTVCSNTSVKKLIFLNICFYCTFIGSFFIYFP